MILFINPYPTINKFGPAIHASEFIDYVRTNKKERIYELSFFEGNKGILKKNGKLKTLFTSLLFILPTQAARYFSLSNIIITVKVKIKTLLI